MDKRVGKKIKGEKKKTCNKTVAGRYKIEGGGGGYYRSPC